MFALALLGGIGGLLASGLMWQHWAEWRDRKRYAAPGSFVDTSDCRLHVLTLGSGDLPVILEAGIAASSVGWTRVHSELAKLTRVSAYDRPGLAYSERGSASRSQAQFVSDLRKVIEKTGSPVILVGHSFGGLLVRLYAAGHPEDVAGLVLVDPALVGEWAEPSPGRLRMLGRGVALSRRGAWLARIGFVRLSLALLTSRARGLSKGFARVSSGHGSSTLDRLVGEVRKLPPELWPVLKAHWCRAVSFTSMAEHLASLPAIAAAVARTSVAPEIPVTVISGAHLSPAQLAEHAAIAAASLQGKHLIAEGSGHWVHLDRPDLIVRAVTDMLTLASTGHAASRRTSEQD